MLAGLSDIVGVDRMTYFYTRDSIGGIQIMAWKSTEAGWHGHLLGDEFNDEKEF